MSMEYVIKASYGNDSIALIQWMADHGHGPRSWVLYNDTGWSHPDWAKRVERGEAFARGLGMQTARTHSPGFVSIARVKQAFPRSGMQFCTTMLKIAWAQSAPGQYAEGQEFLFGCDAGYCGT